MKYDKNGTCNSGPEDLGVECEDDFRAKKWALNIQTKLVKDHDAA